MRRTNWVYAGWVIVCLTHAGSGWSNETKKSPPQENLPPLRATVRTVQERDGKTVADIVLREQCIITLYGWAGGLSPRQRAEKVAERLNEVLALGATFDTFIIDAPHFEEAIIAFGRPIITATFEDHWATGLARELLINQWYTNLIRALCQREPQSHGDIVLVDEGISIAVIYALDEIVTASLDNAR